MRWGKRAAALVMALVVLLSGSIVAGAQTEKDYSATLNADTALYSEADINSQVIAQLKQGSALTVLESTRKDMVKVNSDGVVGYCPTRYLYATSSSLVKLIANTKADLNFRRSPEIGDNVIEVIDEGLYLDITDNSSADWAEVIHNARIGYISKDYLTVCVVLQKNVFNQDLPNWTETLESEIKSISFSDENVSIMGENSSRLLVFSSIGTVVNSKLTFKSSAPEVASVDSDGVVTAHSNGTAEITAALNGNSAVTAKCSVSVSGIAVPADPISISESNIEMFIGQSHTLTAVSGSAVTWSSSDSAVAEVLNGTVTAKAEGTAIITADNKTAKAQCTVRVTKGTAVHISSAEASVSAGKTLFLNSETTGAVWKSSNTDIAQIEQMTDKYGNEFAFVLGKKQGSVTLTAETSTGAAFCHLTVNKAEPVRFAYSSPNSATIGSTVTFTAITDLERTDVKFEYSLNGSAKKSVNASDRVIDGNTAVWNASVRLDSAGTYDVTAFAKTASGSFETCSDAKTTAFVTSVSDPTTTTCERRRASENLMPMFASWEGYRPNVELDDLTGSDPTLGHGRVVSVGTTFYNSITRREAMAYLYETVNTAGYSDGVNSYLLGNDIKFNQQQFDSLVCFAYNFGPYALSYYDDINDILLNTYSEKTDIAVGSVGTITGDAVRVRSGPSTDYTILKEVDTGDRVTLLSTEMFNNSWRSVQLADGTQGYIHSDYISFASSQDTRDLNNIDKQEYIETFMPYHHASGICYWGLIYRRVDEIEMFFEGDYEQDGRNNKYGYKFRCHRDPDVYIGY